MSKHTPGPWIASPYWNGWSVIAPGKAGCGNHSLPIADVHFPVDALRSVEREHNAKLISAAPDLLEMVERLIHQGERCNWFGDRLDEELAQEARDLIARALGQESKQS